MKIRRRSNVVILIPLKRVRPPLIIHKIEYFGIDVVVIRISFRYGCRSVSCAQILSSNDNLTHYIEIVKRTTSKTTVIRKKHSQDKILCHKMKYTLRKNSPSKYVPHRKKNSSVNYNFNKCEINMLIPNYFGR